MADIDKVISAYGDKLVFLLMGGFLVAKAIEKVNLHKRFALNTLKIVGTKPKNIIPRIYNCHRLYECRDYKYCNHSANPSNCNCGNITGRYCTEKKICNMFDSVYCICCKSGRNVNSDWYCTQMHFLLL